MSVWTSPDDRQFHLALADTVRHRLGHAIARSFLRGRLALALSGGLLAALAVASLLARDPAPRPVEVGAMTDPAAWVRKADASGRMVLKSPALAGMTQTASVWAPEFGDAPASEDRLVVGTPEGDGPFIMLVATRLLPGMAEGSLFVSAVRTAAKAGLSVARFAPGAGHVGRFGPTETGRASLLPAFSTARAGRDCVAVRAVNHEPDVMLSGFVCLPGGDSADAGGAECLLRTLAATEAADMPLRKLLQPLGPDGGGCGGKAPAPREARLSRAARAKP